jgi:hypothetical protein
VRRDEQRTKLVALLALFLGAIITYVIMSRAV